MYMGMTVLGQFYQMMASGLTCLTSKKKAHGDGGHRRQILSLPTGCQTSPTIRTEKRIVLLCTNPVNGTMPRVKLHCTTFARKLKMGMLHFVISYVTSVITNFRYNDVR